jgi:nucleoid DNA-binding protein
LAAVKGALRQGRHIEIRGFGTFKVAVRKPRTARNPRTGETVPLPERKVPVFKVSRDLKERVAKV